MKFSKTSAISPPPPPSESAPQKRKSSRKTLFAVIAVLLIVLIIAGVYAAATMGVNKNTITTPTATPSSGNTSPYPTASNSGSVNVAGANSLQYSVTVTNSSGATVGTYTYYAKAIGKSNMAIRIESTDPDTGDNMVYIVNGGTQQAWMEVNGEWTDMSTAFSSQFSSWKTSFTGYENSLANWAGTGDYTYSTPDGSSVKLFNISINPALQDSLFTHS